MMECDPRYMDYVNECADENPKADDVMGQLDFDNLHDENMKYLTEETIKPGVFHDTQRAICYMERLAAMRDVDCCAPSPTWGYFWKLLEGNYPLTDIYPRLFRNQYVTVCHRITGESVLYGELTGYKDGLFTVRAEDGREMDVFYEDLL